MSCNWFPTKVFCFHECLLTQFRLFAFYISVCTDTEHQGNRYPAARNSASPPETFTQQLNTPGTITILQGVNNWNATQDWSHKSHNTPVTYPTMHHSEQKCEHFRSEWWFVGYGTGALWDLWIWFIVIHPLLTKWRYNSLAQDIGTNDKDALPCWIPLCYKRWL